ncbi:AMP-binding protein [Nocardioides sp. CPCC 206347]|uniref:AMP-binding protein n=1 Tax=unclassified Nocardioides TaxID=2615069 RepID=UPI00361F3523
MSSSSTVCQAFQQTAKVNPDAVAVRTPGDKVSVTWRELSDRVRKVAAGLASLGVKRGDTVAIMVTNRPESAWIDAGAMHLGATAFSIYNTSAPEQVAYLFSNAENRVVFTETALLPTILASGAPLEHVIVVDGKPEGATMTLAELEAAGDPDFDFDAAWKAVTPDDLLTLIYTSGTTGPPKGVQLTHGNLMSILESVTANFPMPFGGRITSFLPMAHIADRATSQYGLCARGTQVTYIADPRTIAAALPDCKPTIWFAVPRVWEKIKAGVEAKVANEPDDKKRKIAQFALGMAEKKADARLAGKGLNPIDSVKFAVADKLVLSKMREALGMQELVWAWSGAAAISPETLKFFIGLGIEVCELWGMSETCGGSTLNPPGKQKLGTVGPAIPGVEIKLAEDGELLVRGPGNMIGYRKDPEKTAEALDADGWIHTGDIGTVDEDGYYSIVDRKKELIISAAGKNMSPSNIENTLKVTTPLAAAIVCIGDARAFNTALVVLDPDAAAAYAEKAGVAADPAVLAKDPGLRALIQQGIDAGNAKLSRVEQVKKFEVVPSFWMPGGDELTPTLKLKRKPIAEKYSAQIDALYA